MWGTFQQLTACLVLLALGQLAYTQDFDPSSYCALVAENFKFADVADCSIYYTCVNGAAVQSSCAASQYYNKDTKQCTSSASVCSQNKDPCLGTVGGVFVPQPGNCKGYIYCKDGQFVGSSVCPNNMTFIDGTCSYADCPSTGSAQLDSLCQIFPVNVYFGSFDDCTIWQICKTGNSVPTTGNCNTAGKEAYVYDAKIQQCNIPTDGTCAGRGAGATPVLPTAPCTEAEKDQLLADAKVCSVYYTCDGTAWVKTNCPVGQFYDLVDKKCKTRQAALPSSTCDRCEGTSATFVNAVDPNCNKYLYCVNSQNKETGNCAADKFFNEGLGVCSTADTTAETAYVEANGACKPCAKSDCVATADSLSCTDSYGRTGCTCPAVPPCDA